MPRHGFFVRLYTGTGAFDVVGKRKLWYAISGVIVAICARQHRAPRLHLRHRLRGRHQGVDARGRASGAATTEQVEDVFTKTLGKSARVGGAGRQRPSATVQIRVGDADQRADRRSCATALFDAFQPKGADGQPSKQAISDSAVSETWGGQITKKALIALVVFLVLVTIYITVRYERYMAHRGAGGAGVRPRRHRRASTRSSASRSRRPR